MNDLLIVIICVLIATNSATCFLLYKKKHQKDLTPPPDFQMFLQDLMLGGAILKIHRVNPDDVMLVSPRRGR